MPKTGSKGTGAYVAFLLGINVGGNKRVPMAELKTACERMGFTNVRTVLASGNVVFDATTRDTSELAHALEAALQKRFGFEVGVIARTADEIRKMIAADPFKGIMVGKDTRLYVTFMSEQPARKIKTPHKYSEKGSTYLMLDISRGAVFGVLELGDTRTIDAMNILGKMLGKKITTRNWNTIHKLLPETARPVAATPTRRRPPGA